ncbi:hypothetical protein P3X46_027561 [Hevea brasiliensis]|uniref:Protein kinase domain-containing protein n=1 Tax=Hevea brasiliensis TaxID=3981 RepID=A0ABQ9L1R0_HEVBR|nr:hypothetical protein P3X46_027561 [Hevea brasiliensis]
MAQEQDQEPKRLQYPLDSRSCEILDEIGVGVSAIVYKAISDFDYVRWETKIMSLLSHSNILKTLCSFTVGRRLWVLMPFMSTGSLQSIISSSFPDGLSEHCCHLHRDIKASNILIDSIRRVKLADFGVSASICVSNAARGWASLTCLSRLMLTDVAGTPYGMAPEVIHSHTGYSFKADIWSFGITAWELAHGRPPLSHLPLSKSLIMKITERFRFSDYEKHKKDKSKKFFKAFKDMKLLKHPFFKNCRGLDFLVKNVLPGLPSIEERFKESKALHGMSTGSENGEEEGIEGDTGSEIVKIRKISGWNFNREGFELDPKFPNESKDDSIVKQVRFGGETIIQDMKIELINEAKVNSQGEDGHGDKGIDKERMVGGLMVLKRTLDEQRQKVANLIGLLGGEVSEQEQLVQVDERLRMELESEKQKNFDLVMELEFHKQLISGAYDGCGTESWFFSFVFDLHSLVNDCFCG